MGNSVGQCVAESGLEAPKLSNCLVAVVEIGFGPQILTRACHRLRIGIVNDAGR